MEKPKKPKKKQNQPKTQAGKTRAVVAARRKKIIKAVLEGKTQKQAGIEAGLSPKTAQKQVSQTLLNPTVNKTFLDILNEQIPSDFHSNVYFEGMKANKVISANVIAMNGEGMADAHSMTKDFIEVEDHPTRIKAADSAAKLKGLIVDKSQNSFDERTLEAILNALPAAFADQIRKNLFGGGK
jgi:phage terminase small subunit